MDEQVKKLLHHTLPKDLIIDLFDAVTARALAANKMINDHAGLDTRRARMVVGRVRFPMQEKSFHDVCVKHGGRPLDGDLIPGTDLKIFQPFMRFQNKMTGVILGFASMPEKARIPAKNLSRVAGVTLNYTIVPRLDFDGTGPKPGDIFVLFLVARDPANAGKVAEVAIGIVDSEYQSFLYYETVEAFLAGYAEDSEKPQGPSPKPLVKLKPKAKPFVRPEAPPSHANDDKDHSAS